MLLLFLLLISFNISVITYYLFIIWTNRKYLYIVRGLPGSGKTTLINDIVTDHLITDSFSKLSFQDYYDDNPRNLPKCYNMCFNAFMNEVYLGTRFIFLDNPNIEYWEYEHYLTYGKLNNYTIIVLDIKCPNENYVEYFWKRCNSHLSLDNMFSQYNRWEDNSQSIKIDPYLLGDSLPYPKVTREELDKQLDEYRRNQQKLKSQ